MADDPQAARPLQLAAAITPDPAVKCSAEVVAADQLAAVEWEKVALLLWQAPLPEGDAAKLVQAFVDRGGQVDLLPAPHPGQARVPGRALDDLGRQAQDVAGRELAGRSGPAGPHPERRGAAGRAAAGPQILRARGRVHAAGHAPAAAPRFWRGSTTNAGRAYFCATTPAAGDSSLATDGVVLLRAGPARPGRGARRSWAARGSSSPATRPARKPGAVEASWRGPRTRSRPDYPAPPAASTRRAIGSLAVNRAAAEDPAPVLADDRVAELFRGLDFRPRGRPGGQHQLADPGDLAAVPGRHDGGDGRRGGPLPARGPRDRAGVAVMNVTAIARRSSGRPGRSSLSILARAGHGRASASSPGGGAATAARWACSSCSGWRSSVVAAVMLNQPEWVEEYRPEEKPADRRALGRLAQHGDARRRRSRQADGSPPTTRREAIAPLAEPSTWSKLRERMNVVIQPFSAAQAGARHRPERAARRRRSRRSRTCAGSSWPPTATGTKGRRRSRPRRGCGSRACRSSPCRSGSPTRLPDVELLSLDAPTFGVAGKSVRIPFTIESSLPREYVTTVTLAIVRRRRGHQGSADRRR